MNIKRTELLKALETVRPGLARNALIPQAMTFAFIDGAVVTYNDEISICTPLADGIALEGAINADELYKLVKKLKEDEVTITQSKKGITIAAGRTTVGMHVQREVNLPLDEIDTSEEWYELNKDFITLADFTRKACATDSTRPLLTTVNFTVNGCIEASDALRLIRAETGMLLPVEQFLIPDTSVAEMVKITPTEIARGRGWVHWRNPSGTILSCRVFADEYMDVSPYLEVEGVEITLPKTLRDTLDVAGVFAHRDRVDDEEVTITIANNRIKVYASGESGWIEEEANIRYNEEQIQFRIVPYILYDILKETQTCIVSEKRLKFSGAGWVYITALL